MPLHWKNQNFYKSVVLCIFLAFEFGCTSIDFRKREMYQCFSKASPGDQKIAASGQIREGMARCLVYVAWDSPRRTNSSVRGEIWFYDSSLFDSLPQNVPVSVEFGTNYVIKYVPRSMFNRCTYNSKYAVFVGENLVEWAYKENNHN